MCVCVCVGVVWLKFRLESFSARSSFRSGRALCWAFLQVPRSMGRCGGAGGKGVNNEQAKGKGKGSGKSQPSGRGFGSSQWGAGGYGGFRNEQGSSLQKETLAQLIKNNRRSEKTDALLVRMLAAHAKDSPSVRVKQEPKAQKDT